MDKGDNKYLFFIFSGRRILILSKLVLLVIFFLLNGCTNISDRLFKVTFSVNLKNHTDNKKVFITGNQSTLGNWKPDSVMLSRINDTTFEKSIYFKEGTQVEFKVTAGNWWQEALDSNYIEFQNIMLRVNRDTTIHILVYDWKNSFVDGNIVFNAKRFLPDRKAILIDNRWKYQSGDNKRWALTDYNDSSWQTTDSYINWPDSPVTRWQNVGWFRFHFIADTSIWNTSLAINISQFGASQIYYNGKLLYSFGEIGESRSSFKPKQVRIWKTLTIEPKRNQLLAVRYANYDWHAQREIGFTPGFVVFIKSMNSILDNAVNMSHSNTTHQMVFTIIPLMLFLLHISLFGFYPDAKVNLYYAICLLGFAGITYFGYQKFVSTDPQTIILFYRLNGVSVPLTIFFALLVGYEFRYRKLPGRWIVFLAIFIVVALNSYIKPLGYTSTLYYIFFGLAMLDTLISIFLSGWVPKMKNEWVGYIGFVILIGFVIIQILIDYSIVAPPFGENQVFVYGMLALAISITISLSFDFASINRNLQVQLVTVQKLSEKTIQQERTANRLEIERRVIEVENERKSKELESARELQLSLLPKVLPRLPNIEIAAFMETATEVGGDYYDAIISKSGSLILAAGDATGHGVKAGTLVAVVKSLLFDFSDRLPVDETLSQMNIVLRSMKLGNLFMGLTLLKIDGFDVDISSAGMPPTIIFRKETNMIEEVIIKRMPLGATDKMKFERHKLKIKSGDVIVLLSDGLPELFNDKKDMFEFERVKELIIRNPEGTPQEIINMLKTEAIKWLNGFPQSDDITLVVVKCK